MAGIGRQPLNHNAPMKWLRNNSPVPMVSGTTAAISIGSAFDELEREVRQIMAEISWSHVSRAEPKVSGDGLVRIAAGKPSAWSG